ncbi:MAG: hypothetical protein JW929_11670 [Anaerolineales bacterium]|nr:hypothetical protein [Anaerolineales bacterium]
MKKMPMLAAAAAGALMVLAGCSSFPGGTRLESTRSWKSDFTSKTETIEDTLTVEPGMALHTLTIRSLELSAGSLRLSLAAPDGTIVWEQTFTAPASFRHEVRPEYMEGEWRLRGELTGATGRYDIAWRAANTP